MKISCVIILYNPKNEYIDNIKELSKTVDKIFVIDNSSVKLKCRFSNNVEYYHYKDNIGVAKSLNIAASKSINDNYKWMLTLDQDSKISKYSIEKLKDYIYKNNTDNIGIVSPYQVTLKNEELKKEKEEQVFEVMTSGNMLNLDVYKKVGPFDENLFIDGVDTEYCLRLNKYDYKIVRLNYLKIKHNLGNQHIKRFLNKDIICSNHKPIRRYYMFRNMLYIYNLYYNVYPAYVRFLKRVQMGQIKRIILFENDKIKKIRYIVKGYFDYKNKKMGKLEE